RQLPEPAVPDPWPDRRVETGGVRGPRGRLAPRVERLLADRRTNTNVSTLPREDFEYAEILGDGPLRTQATNDLFWDRITSVQPQGEEAVFDLTVPGPGCWLADGVVSHNSGALEQDADVILFLYRQSQYKEDLPPEEANVAEVIIGKQRNGPVGTVRVVFLPQYARFENVADLHRQPQPF
ncbi:MAG: DnaB-like helicase C-terminal domain-containing protein, partial [candidate division NC10 bacterium]